MTEEEKMLAGEIYDANYDKVLLEKRVKAKEFTKKTVLSFGNPCKVMKSILE